jgi:hypothetical protein
VPLFPISSLRKITSGFFKLLVCALSLHAQMPTDSEPTIFSLKQHPLPQWYADAKLGKNRLLPLLASPPVPLLILHPRGRRQ